MDTAESETLLKQAMAAVNAGELTHGRASLEKILESDPQNEWAWIWLSGCVGDPIQRRICLQQALKANPENQAALDGMKVLDGELVQVSGAGSSLLESRLAAIGIGEQVPDVPAVAAEAPSPAEPMPPAMDVAQEQAITEPKPRRRWLLVLVFLVVLFLAVLVCGLVATQVVLPTVLPMLGTP
jgi:hypothetical protein